MSPRHDDLILLSDAAYTVRVSEHQMGQLVANCQIAVRMTPDGKQSITRSDFESLAYSPEAKEASLQGLIQQIQTRETTIQLIVMLSSEEKSPDVYSTIVSAFRF